MTAVETIVTTAEQFQDWNAAARMATIMKKMIDKRMDDMRPLPRYATVVSVTGTGLDRVVELQFPGDAETFVIENPGAVIPTKVGETVRVGGTKSDRFIETAMGETVVASNIFELLDDTGAVVSEWKSALDAYGNDSLQLKMRFPANNPPYDNELDAGVQIAWRLKPPAATAFRGLSLVGPRADYSSPPYRGFVHLLANDPDLTIIKYAAGNEQSQVGFHLDTAGGYCYYDRIQDTTLARWGAGGSVIEIVEGPAGAVQYARLRRGASGASEDIATSPTTNGALTANASFGLTAGRDNLASKSGRVCIVQGAVTNTSGAVVATPVAVATVPTGYRPPTNTVGGEGRVSTLGMGNFTMTTAGVITCNTPAGNIPINGVVEFSFVYTVPL